MRKMTDEEMESFMASASWATICTVTPEGDPYAIEATPFRDGEMIGFMINPKGTTARNVKANPKVLVKFTFASEDLSDWKGVSCFGTGEFVQDADAIRRGWDLLGKVVKTDYSTLAEKFCADPGKSPMFCVTVEKMTGRCSR